MKVLVECPSAWDLIGVMPIGYAAETRERARRPLEPLVFQDTFGNPWFSDAEEGGTSREH